MTLAFPKLVYSYCEHCFGLQCTVHVMETFTRLIYWVRMQNDKRLSTPAYKVPEQLQLVTVHHTSSHCG